MKSSTKVMIVCLGLALVCGATEVGIDTLMYIAEASNTPRWLYIFGQCLLCFYAISGLFFLSCAVYANIWEQRRTEEETRLSHE